MKLRIALAYLGVVLIWTTTPLAIKWSSGSISFVLGVTARMTIGLSCLLLLLLLMRRRLPLHPAALWTYLAVSLQTFVSMLVTYWAAQFIPSGWLSVIFGLSPFMTAFMAAAYLKERSLSWAKLFAYSLGLGGLIVMFSSAAELNALALQGVVGMLIATFIHSASAVWVKRIQAGLPALQQITGGLLISVPLFWITWYGVDAGELPQSIPSQTLYAILYLGLIATTLGFALYYFILSQLPATNVAMLNLMTPLMSLLLGYVANQEPLSHKTLIGTALIMAALLSHEIADHRQRKAVH